MSFRTRLGLALVTLGVVGLQAPVRAQGLSDLLDRPARLDVSDATLADALRALQRASGVTLAYSPDLLPVEARVTCACSDRTVRAALDVLLAGTDLVYESARTQVLIGRRRAAGTNGAPPSIVGVVVEAGSGRPIPSAEVRSASGGSSTLSGDDGRFVLRGAGDAALVVSSLGYHARTLPAPAAAGPLRVELERAPIPLADVVISPGRFGVLEVHPAVSATVVTREDIEAIPQFGDDVFRTLKRMPGVSAEDISTRLNVRGGTDRDLLVRLDGVELYEPYHMKDLDGALGIVDVQALGGIDLVTGGFPAEFGDKTAGVFDMHTRAAPAQGTRTTLGFSLSSLSAISQGGFADGRGQWLGSLRRGFLQYALAVTGVDDELKPTFWDALGRVQYLAGDGHLLWLQGLYGADDMRWFDESTSSSVTSTWSNGYAWAGWKADWSGRVRSETVVSLGRLSRDRAGLVETESDGAFTPVSASVDDVGSFDVAGIRQDWQADLGTDLLVKAGADARRSSASYDYASSAPRYDLAADGRPYLRTDTSDVVAEPRGVEVGSYLAVRGRTGARLTWELGVRHDWIEHTGDNDLAPRLLLRVDLDPTTSVKGSWGRYFQSQGVHELHVQDGERTFAPSERAEQVAVGLERAFAGGGSVRLEAYHRTIASPLPLFVNLAREVNPIMELESDRRRLDPSEARASGVELIVARDGTGRGSWSASYALARSEDRVDGTWVPRTLDQRHTLNLRAAYRFGTVWQLSGVWSYHSGWPFTEQVLDIDVVAGPDGTPRATGVRRGFGPLNADRLPAYHRMDVRLTRAFEHERSRLELYLDVFNVYNRTNLRGFDWTLRRTGNGFRAHRSDGEEQLPILPTLGVRWVF